MGLKSFLKSIELEQSMFAAHISALWRHVMDVTFPEYQEAPDFAREPVRSEQVDGQSGEAAPPGLGDPE